MVTTEFAQYWIGRSATLDDIVIGLFGVLTGYAAYRATRALIRRI